MAAWYYSAGPEQHGPVGDDEVRTLIRDGKIADETVVWREGAEERRVAASHPELAEVFATLPEQPGALEPGFGRASSTISCSSRCLARA